MMLPVINLIINENKGKMIIICILTIIILMIIINNLIINDHTPDHICILL